MQTLSVLSITASYVFVDLPRESLEGLREELFAFGKDRDMRGLVLIATEGLNSTVSGSLEAIEEWKLLLTEKFGPVTFKDSTATRQVFVRWSVKMKNEIVAIKNPSIHPGTRHRHVSPEEWHQLMQRDDVVVIDARNSYEYKIGKFKNAVDPGTRAFSQFPGAVAKLKIPKNKKVMMYCTGGIRCEKAIYAMEEQGYEDVVQLEGGILAYLQQFPEGTFEGECFVFDHRVAVDGHLQPSKIYDLCPHCGDPGDQFITCHCGNTQRVCANCVQQEERRTCSKRCAHDALRV